jgi:hypothetical protein
MERMVLFMAVLGVVSSALGLIAFALLDRLGGRKQAD